MFKKISKIEILFNYESVERTGDNDEVLLSAMLHNMEIFIQNVQDSPGFPQPAKEYLNGIKKQIIGARNSALNSKMAFVKTKENIGSGKKSKFIGIIPKGMKSDNIDSEDYELLAALIIYKSAGTSGVSLNGLWGSPSLAQAYLGVVAYHYVEDQFLSRDELKDLQGAKTAFKNFSQEGQKLIAGFQSERDKLSNEIERAKDQLALVEKQAKAFADFKQLDGYFSEKSESHWRQHKYWLVGFGIGLVLIFVLLRDSWGSVVSLLPVWSSDSYEVGKAIVLAACVGALVWVFRIAMKMATLHLRLSEDAKNRTVLIRTLASLEAHRGKGMSLEERVIAYNAIFRSSLPDNADLDIAHPSIADLSGLLKK